MRLRMRPRAVVRGRVGHEGCGHLRLRPRTSTAYSAISRSKYAAFSGVVTSSHSHSSRSGTLAKAGKNLGSPETWSGVRGQGLGVRGQGARG